MPWKSLKQELWMRRNKPEVWRRFVAEVGHAPGYKAEVKKTARKAARTRAKNKARKTARKKR